MQQGRPHGWGTPHSVRNISCCGHLTYALLLLLLLLLLLGPRAAGLLLQTIHRKHNTKQHCNTYTLLKVLKADPESTVLVALVLLCCVASSNWTVRLLGRPEHGHLLLLLLVILILAVVVWIPVRCQVVVSSYCYYPPSSRHVTHVNERKEAIRQSISFFLITNHS